MQSIQCTLCMAKTLTFSPLCFKFPCVVDLMQRLSNHTQGSCHAVWTKLGKKLDLDQILS